MLTAQCAVTCCCSWPDHASLSPCGTYGHRAGEDLHKVLWLKSRNSEVWLDRRTTYTRSTAVMSMVGYLLGLGDRHPSNLMLDRYSGKLLHIDFGDCFEASMNREKFPEKVPFRLTRMMERAMEVSGIEGNFRCCSAEPHTATAAAAAGAVLSAALACAWSRGLQAAGPDRMRPNLSTGMQGCRYRGRPQHLQRVQRW